jgi:hypothetical protein
MVEHIDMSFKENLLNILDYSFKYIFIEGIKEKIVSKDEKKFYDNICRYKKIIEENETEINELNDKVLKISSELEEIEEEQLKAIRYKNTIFDYIKSIFRNNTKLEAELRLKRFEKQAEMKIAKKVYLTKLKNIEGKCDGFIVSDIRQGKCFRHSDSCYAEINSINYEAEWDRLKLQFLKCSTISEIESLISKEITEKYTLMQERIKNNNVTRN